MKLSALSPYRWVRKFHSNSKELTFSLLSSTAEYFIYRPLTSHWRGKTQKQASKNPQNHKTQKHPTKTSYLWLACPPSPRDQMLLFSDTQRGGCSGELSSWASISLYFWVKSTLMITALDYSTNIYWTSPISSSADQMLTEQLFVLCRTLGILRCTKKGFLNSRSL